MFLDCSSISRLLPAAIGLELVDCDGRAAAPPALFCVALRRETVSAAGRGVSAPALGSQRLQVLLRGGRRRRRGWRRVPLARDELPRPVLDLLPVRRGPCVPVASGDPRSVDP